MRMMKRKAKKVRGKKESEKLEIEMRTRKKNKRFKKSR